MVMVGSVSLVEVEESEVTLRKINFVNPISLKHTVFAPS